jgi:hypothetical protein
LFLALITNLIALGAALLGMPALAIGAGPRTARNDLYHRMMMILIFVLRASTTQARLKQRDQTAYGRLRVLLLPL